MPDTPEELIERRLEEGEKDSSGVFTLDSGRAEELLEKSLLEEPQLYALCLLAGAISHGAAELKLQVEPQLFELVYQEPLLEHEELELLSKAPNQAPHVRNYHLGLTAVRALRPRQIVIESASGQEGHRLTLSEGKSELKPSSRLAPGTRISIQFSKGLFAGWGRGARPDPVALIRERCGLALQPIRLNGQKINRELALGKPLMVRQVYPEGAEELVASARSDLTLRTEGAYRAVLALTSSSQAVVICNGVSFPYEGELEFRQIRLVVYSDDLRVDLSQARLVKDARWEELSKWIDGEVRKLIGQLDQRWELLTPDEQALALPYLDRLAELESRAGNLKRAQTIYERLLVMRAQKSDSTDPDVLLNLSNLGTLYFLQSRHDQALEIFLAIAEDLQKLGRVQEAATYYERVMGLETQVSSAADTAILKALVGWAECCLEEDGWTEAEVLLRSALSRLRHTTVDPELASRLYLRLERLGQIHPEFAEMAFFQLAPTEPGCRRCGSRKIHLKQPVESLAIEGKHLLADVCGACGYVELTLPDCHEWWQERLAKPEE